jgi:predicted small integral membrane protein
MIMPTSQITEWSRLGREISRRMREPTKRVSFVVYFFAVVLLLGGMGWVIPLCRLVFSAEMKVVSELPVAFSTFLLALLAGAMADIVLSENGSTEESPFQETTKGFRIFALGLSLLGIPLAFAGIQSSRLVWAYVASILGMIISLFLWWVLNADKSRWRDKPIEPIAATGGTTSVELKGSTEGLTI